jgi:hypothetical protein
LPFFVSQENVWRQIKTSHPVPLMKYETLAVHCDRRNTMKTLLQNAVYLNVTAAGTVYYLPLCFKRLSMKNANLLRWFRETLLNTLRTGDADLHFYITIVQDG